MFKRPGTPLLLLLLVSLTVWQALEEPSQRWSGLFPTGPGPEWWRLLTFAFNLGEPGQAILSLLTLALVAPGLEQLRGGTLGLAARWLIASLALGACQRVGHPIALDGPTLIGLTLLTETALVGFSQPLAPRKTWTVLFLANAASALFQGWILPTLFLSLFLGALVTVVTYKLEERRP